MPEFREQVAVEAVCKAETTDAILVEVDGEDFWIPQSQIDDDSEVFKKGDEGTLVISQWIAEKKGLA